MQKKIFVISLIPNQTLLAAHIEEVKISTFSY